MAVNQPNLMTGPILDINSENTQVLSTKEPVIQPEIQGQENQNLLLAAKSSDTDSYNDGPKLKAPAPPSTNGGTTGIKRLARKRGGKQEGTKKNNVCLRYEDNNSKHWDGKVVSVDREWIKEVTNDNDLPPGKHLTIPWPIKGGSIEQWKAVIVDESFTKKQKQEKSVGNKTIGSYVYSCYIMKNPTVYD